MTEIEQYRVRIVGTVGPMSPYGTHGSRLEAERLLGQVTRMQEGSPFPTGGAWIERESAGEWQRGDAR